MNYRSDNHTIANVRYKLLIKKTAKKGTIILTNEFDIIVVGENTFAIRKERNNTFFSANEL